MKITQNYEHSGISIIINIIFVFFLCLVICMAYSVSRKEQRATNYLI